MKTKTPKMFQKMGQYQNYIMTKIVLDDFFLMKTVDNRDHSEAIELVDDHGNLLFDIKQKELDALLKRGFLLEEDVSKCLELTQTKFYLNEEFAEEVMNACIS